MEASGSDQADYPALVKGMARDYISRPASIIVAVVTCKEDLDTQVWRVRGLRRDSRDPRQFYIGNE